MRIKTRAEMLASGWKDIYNNGFLKPPGGDWHFVPQMDHLQKLEIGNPDKWPVNINGYYVTELMVITEVEEVINIMKSYGAIDNTTDRNRV